MNPLLNIHMETILQEKIFSPLEKGIKLIGIGKHGSKKLPDELIVEILEQLKTGSAEPVLTGAFFGALLMKDIEPSYYLLEEYTGAGSLANPVILWNSLCKEAPSELESIGAKLLRKQTLTLEEAETLGTFLFSDEPGELFRGMAVSILRIRYESEEEYRGIYNVLVRNTEDPISQVSVSKPVVQLAEPFDGIEHSYLITPLIANEIQKDGYTVVSACSRNSGPKRFFNNWDIYKSMETPFIKDKADLFETAPETGWALDQKDFFPALDKWVDRRRIILKRPFLATLEKVLNPLHANILVTSVFHIPYLEKMAELAAMAGFTGVIVLKRGLEGTLAPALAKATGVFCAARNSSGLFVTTTFDMAADEDLFFYKREADDIIENISLADNVKYIRQYLEKGETGNNDFDHRVMCAAALYRKGLEWITSVQA